MLWPPWWAAASQTRARWRPRPARNATTWAEPTARHRTSDDAHADLLGWHDGKMVFFWSHAPAVVRTLDLEGREEVLLAIPEGWWDFYPIEGPYLICCTPDGVAVIDLRTQERRVMIVRTADGASRKLMVANSLADMKWDGWQVVTTSPV